MKRTILKKIISLSLVFAMGMTMLAGCSNEGVTSEETGSSAVSTSNEDDTLTIGLYSEIISLDSAFAYDFVTNPVVIQMTEGLLYYDVNDELQCGLAESWERMDDVTYVYNVRKDINFSDGTPMTMDDVMFSIQRYQDPEVASYIAWMYDNVESIEVTGDWQFTVHLTQPDALWEHTFATTAGHIHSKAYVEAHPDNYGTPEGGVLGTGPYEYVSWDVGSQIVMKYNENYWDKSVNPQIKNLVFQIVEEDTTRVMASTAGQIDINLSTPVEMIDDVESSEIVNLTKIASAGLEFLSFNCSKAPFNDVNVRRAVAYAIDEVSLQENLIKDFGTLTNGIPVPESLFLFEEDTWKSYETTCQNYAYDLTAAKEALAASGYPDGLDCTLLIDEKSMNNSIALVIQQSLAEIGINVTIEKVSNDEVVSYQFGSGIDENGVRPYEFALFEWSSDFPDPSGVLTPLYASWNAGDGGSNSCAYSNEEVDALLLAQAASTDEVERTDIMLQALDIINDEVPNYVYTHQNWLFTVNNRVTGGMDTLTGTWFWNIFVKNITIE